MGLGKKRMGVVTLLWLFVAMPVGAAKLHSVSFVDKDYIQVVVLDGEITHKDDGLGPKAFTQANQSDADIVTEYTPFLSVSEAANKQNWVLQSTSDGAYSGNGLAVSQVFRKTKMNGHAQQAWSGNDYIYKKTFTHTLYLKVPHSLKQGMDYTLKINASTQIDVSSKNVTFDVFQQVSEAIHINLVGYDISNSIKAADLHLWMGDGGPRDYKSFEGNKVYLYNTETKQKTEVNTVSLWKATSTNDMFWRDQTKSPVWKVDFTGFNTPGTYRLVVDGVGASPDFEIADDVYFDPFFVAMQGYLYMRIGQDSTGGVWPVPRRPLYIPGVSPTNTVVYLTTMHPFHAEWKTMGGGGDKWDLKDEWAKYVKPGKPTNNRAYGGHSDAADWDRRLEHVSIIYDMLLPYLLSEGKLSDDNLELPESGNGIPDVVDEARHEVDFWLNLRDGVGYSHGLNNPNDQNVLYQAGPTAVAAWANAANAAMLADAFRVAGLVKLMEEYRDSAVVAWNHANSLADPMLNQTQNIGDGHMRGKDFKMTAAAYLYNVTGETLYEDSMVAASEIKSETSAIQDEKIYDQIWAVAGYLKTPQKVNYTEMYNNMKASVIHQAKTFEASNTKSRASRRATPNGNSLGYMISNQRLPHSMVAHAVTDNAADKTLFRDALTLEADYGLGRNAANLIQMSTATTPLANKRSVEGLYTTGRDDGAPGMHPGHTPYMNLDDWSCGMVMGCPSKLYESNYPADFKKNWPMDESYHNSRYVWAHGEFTPQQTLRGKFAIYAYLYSLKQKVGPVSSVRQPVPNHFQPGQYFVSVRDFSGRLVHSQWHSIENLETVAATVRVPRPGVYSVTLRNKGYHLTLPKVFY